MQSKQKPTTGTSFKVDDDRLAAIENQAMKEWTKDDPIQTAVLDLCADIRTSRGLPQEPGRYPDGFTGSASPYHTNTLTGDGNAGKSGPGGAAMLLLFHAPRKRALESCGAACRYLLVVLI